MVEILRTTFVGLFFGMFGTTIGGVLGSLFDINSNRKLSFILEFSAGLMLSIICFELIPESLKIGLSVAIAILIYDIPEGRNRFVKTILFLPETII